MTPRPSSRENPAQSGAATRYFVTLNGETFSVFIPNDNAENAFVSHGQGGKTYRVFRKELPGDLMVVKGRRSFLISIEEEDNELSVHMGCREGKTTVRTERDILFQKYHAAAKKEDRELRVVSPLPGLVTTVHAAPGATLKKGEAIAIIEAMKMENEIRAPRSCTVAAVKVQEGKTVDKGQVIAILK